MGSATSCFNSTLYRKTMTRFWPLWALYGVIWAFLIPLNLLNQFFWLQERYQGELDLQSMLTSAALDIPYLLTMGVALSLVFGALAAMASFGYLYNNRSAAMMHALPLRREALFTTQYLAGLSCLLLPHLAVALVTAAAELAFLPMECWERRWPPWLSGCWFRAAPLCFSSPLPPSAPCLPATSWPCPPSMSF